MASASIFTFDPDPPRVASPWLQGAGTPQSNEPANAGSGGDYGTPDLSSLSLIENDRASSKVTRLQAEPQEGPVEYKLHLLLRPRRKFRSISTGSHISGSRHARSESLQGTRSASESLLAPESAPAAVSVSAAFMHQTRQHRLEQLTTQLLWRLQQSSPHHTSSATNIILPSLPEALPELQAPQQPAKLLHGLEESQGALYEIGVSDDGTLVGLAEDEMSESLNNLRAMAGCLGCTVEVLRMESVGECEWLEGATTNGKERKVRRTGKLFVAEALVKPFLQTKSLSVSCIEQPVHLSNTGTTPSSQPPPSTEQLRITLIGPTMSGKSTLLGTLTTSTLDNGKGKSRLSMLKHRHEITSGITSSVTQELLGYQDLPDGELEVINYATDNVASWIDIHATATGNRLVFISDSAGHPRYRRTTLKGIIGWAPHWTLLCIPADDSGDTTAVNSTSQQKLSTAVSGMDLSGAQLDLCLRLDLPLAIVITKLDLGSRTGLRETLSKVLDTLKAAGKKPAMLPNSPGQMTEQDLQIVKATSLEGVFQKTVPLLNDATSTVPIVLTSSVDGSGISNLHALLHELPIPPSTANNSDPSSLTIFDIEDIYSKPAEVTGVILSGRLRAGKISVGDNLVIGPFASHDSYDDSDDSDERPLRRSLSHLPASRSFPGALRESGIAAPYFHIPNQEWRRVQVTSIRNLRLPAHSLHVDQVGTIAILLNDTSAQNASLTGLSRVRKGMILASLQPVATRTFTAKFRREDLESLAVGNSVVAYISSVRASAKVMSARAPDSPEMSALDGAQANAQEPFIIDEIESGLDGQGARVAGVVTAPELLVTLSFEASKEYVMVGDRVLVMPGGGPGFYGGHVRGQKGLAGLEGFVGEIVDVRG